MQVVEICELKKHRMEECRAKTSFRVCPRCEEPVERRHFASHVAAKKCPCEFPFFPEMSQRRRRTAGAVCSVTRTSPRTTTSAGDAISWRSALTTRPGTSSPLEGKIMRSKNSSLLKQSYPRDEHVSQVGLAMGDHFLGVVLVLQLHCTRDLSLRPRGKEALTVERWRFERSRHWETPSSLSSKILGELVSSSLGKVR